MKLHITVIGLVVLFTVIHQSLAKRRRKPCKFGDKIEYGHLGKEVKIGGGLDAYVSHPNSTNSKGGVIVIQDIYGWELSNTRAIVDMLMENNFTAILPDAFEGKFAWNRSMSWLSFGSFFEDRPADGVGNVVDACMEYLSNEYSIDKIAIVGFCWGGRAVHHMMSSRKDLVAGVSCYGLMDAEDEDFGILNNSTLFIYGRADRQFNSARIRGLRKALKSKAKAKYAIRGYKDQPHGFLHRKLASPDDPHKEQIYAARRKMIQWLDRYLTK
ncbi:carboxymethylenebutenolidase homolog [Styela clava]